MSRLKALLFSNLCTTFCHTEPDNISCEQCRTVTSERSQRGRGGGAPEIFDEANSECFKNVFSGKIIAALLYYKYYYVLN